MARPPTPKCAAVPLLPVAVVAPGENVRAAAREELSGREGGEEREKYCWGRSGKREGGIESKIERIMCQNKKES